MTPTARIVAPGPAPSRGNHGERIFFGPGDCALYKDWSPQPERGLKRRPSIGVTFAERTVSKRPARRLLTVLCSTD